VAVHAVSTATRTTVAAHEKDRRRNGGALVFIGISKVGATGSMCYCDAQRTTSTNGYIESMAMYAGTGGRCAPCCVGRDRRACRLAASVAFDCAPPLSLQGLEPEDRVGDNWPATWSRLSRGTRGTAPATPRRESVPHPSFPDAQVRQGRRAGSLEQRFSSGLLSRYIRRLPQLTARLGSSHRCWFFFSDEARFGRASSLRGIGNHADGPSFPAGSHFPRREVIRPRRSRLAAPPPPGCGVNRRGRGVAGRLSRAQRST
jgi:hypothetical protein